MTKKILITSALLYANGPLHFGHIAGAYLPGDCYARFQRLLQNDVLYICGSDEYGMAITLSAELAGRTPQEHVDLFHEINVKLFKKLHFSFDHFSRTRWKGHHKPVHQYFLDLIKNGHIEEKITDQLYSEEDHRFLADRYVVGTCPGCGFDDARGDECPKCGASYEATDLKNPRSKVTGAPLSRKPTKHWFLLLDQFKGRLLEWLETKHWKPNVINFAKNYINEMHPRAITRDSQWGVPVPLTGTEGKVLYVWFDAPIGYLSATMEWAEMKGRPEAWKDYWCDPETKLVNFIGKDNITFHAAIFPAMTMGQDQPLKLVDELPANEFFMLEGRQFSKSEGWYIDLDDFFERYTADQIRYTIAANAPETSDSEFTWKDFQSRCNHDLLGKYGNLINRVLVFAHKNCGGHSPKKEHLEAIDIEFLEKVRDTVQEAYTNYSTFKLRKASQNLMELAQHGNIYFDAKKPWKAVKSPETFASMERTVACCLECLKGLALISFPIIPEAAGELWRMLGYTDSLEFARWDDIVETPFKENIRLGAPKILFQKIEDSQIEKEITKLHAMKKPVKKEEVSIEDVRRLDLRVGTVLAAEPIEKSNKLFKVRVDVGTEERTVVAGVRQHYSTEELIGKKVIIVANLKPAKLMGIESQGMLLAGSSDNTLELVTVETLPPGSCVS